MTKPVHVLSLGLIVMLPAAAHAQVAQESVRAIQLPGFHLPTVGGSLVYSLNASESLSTGFYKQGDPAVASNISGNFAYLSPSQIHPFSVVYTGAVLAGTSNQPTTYVTNLAMTQVYATRLWNLNITDGVSYLPATPTTGLSGVAGLGDMGVDPVATGPVTGQGALTGYAPRVTNSTTGSVIRRLSGKTFLNGSGSFVIQRFTGNQAGLINSNETLGSFGLSHILDARSSASVAYNRSKITYSPDTYSSAFNVEGVNFDYARRWGRYLSIDASAGPQWIRTFLVKNHTAVDLATDISAHYTNRSTTASISYVRGTNNGFGVIPGGFSNSVNLTDRHTFSRLWSGSVTMNYTRTSDPKALLLPAYSLNTLVGGIEASRAINRSVSSYVSYNAQHQTTSGVADTSSAYRGLYHVVAFGVTYAPRSVPFGAK